MNLRKAIAAVTAFLVTFAPSICKAQIGWEVCLDPANQQPYSVGAAYFHLDYLDVALRSPIYSASVGSVGTLTIFGGTPPNCFVNSYTGNIPGAFNFFSNTGSMQSDIDDHLAMNFGGPAGALPWCYAMVSIDGTLNLYTAAGAGSSFDGTSDRYSHIESTLGVVDIILTIESVGDAAMLEWVLHNNDAISHKIGLWFGQWVAQINDRAPAQDISGSGLGDTPGFIVVPGQKPLVTEHRFIRSIQASGKFPEVVDFNVGQSKPYGMQVLNGPLNSETYDLRIRDFPGVEGETSADEMVIGSAFFLLGCPIGAPAMPDFIFSTKANPYVSDVSFADTAYIQKFYEKNVSSGQDRYIVQYFRQPWGNANYKRPFSAVVDAPRVLAFNGGQNGLSPNPFTVRILADNSRGFDTVGQEFALHNVQVTLRFAKSTGMSFTAGQGASEVTRVVNGASVVYEQCIKTIAVVNPGQYGHQDFLVQSDGIVAGFEPYEAEVTMSEAPITKLIKGTILAAITPRIDLSANANLISMPWQTPDTSWQFVLNLDPSLYQAFKWDPVSAGYVPSTTAERGTGNWIVTKSDLGSVVLNPAVSQAADALTTGAPPTRLRSGWNIIGNPYNYPVKLGELTGIAAANPLSSFTFQQLVDQGFVAGFLAYWDSPSQTYKYITGVDSYIEPNKGYWIFVETAQDITLGFPIINTEGIPGSSRAANSNPWPTGQNAWRVQLVGRSASTLDDQNFVGVQPDAKTAAKLNIPKAPMAPTQDLNIMVEHQMANGRSLPLAQAVNAAVGKIEWKVQAVTTKAGSFTLTWPNLRSVPSNVRLRLVDLTTNQSRDMRQTSGYTFQTAKAETREFAIQADTGGTSRAVIGNVLVSGNTRAPGSAVTVLYTLSSDATTSIRVLGPSGSEVFTLTHGRADKQGQNSVTWQLRDNANRAVAPGVYRIEIVAETASGDRVRRVEPVNVIR